MYFINIRYMKLCSSTIENTKYSKKPSLIDHILVNSDLVSYYNVNESISDSCDHLLIDFVISVQTSKTKTENYVLFDYKNDKKIHEFSARLKSHDWSKIFSENLDINCIYKSMIDIIVKYRDISFEKKTVKASNKKIDSKTKSLILKKRKFYKLFKDTNNMYYKRCAEDLYQDINISLKDFHCRNYKSIIEKSDNFKTLYRNIKQNSRNSETNVFINQTNNNITDDYEISENFSDVFISNFNRLTHPKYDNINSCDQYLTDFCISKTDVLREILNIKVNKSCLDSELPNILYKKCADIFSTILYNLFNLILLKKEIPDDLKLVTVIPVAKPGKPKGLFSSSRPVSIEKNILKLFCKLIFNNINAFVFKHSLIPKQQYGFRPCFSTFHQLIDIIDTITTSFNDKSLLCYDIIFLDLSSAFDCIRFDTILDNCYESGIRGNCLEILKSYLYDRKQRVKYRECYSEKRDITSGVPQGGIGSPTLFNLSVRKLPSIIQNSNIFQYADDTCLLKPIQDYSQKCANDRARLSGWGPWAKAL